MNKVFEDYFSEIQADMVSIALEYVNNKADSIFIYSSYEEKIVACKVFYKINNKIYETHRINEALAKESNFSYDTSTARQFRLLEIINENMEKIHNLCKEYGKEPPTEVKLCYDVMKNQLRADYGYGLYYTNSSDRTATDIANEWFREIKTRTETDAI